LAGSLLVCTLFATAAYAQDSGQPAKPPPPAVGYVEAAEKDVTPSRNFVGRIEAVARAELRARVTGFLEKQLVEDGAEVKKGDVLFVIEQAPFSAQVQIAEANLEAAKAQQENTKVQLERAEELVKRGNIPRATVDERRADYLVAKASVSQMEAALEDQLITYTYTEITSPIDGRMGRASVKVGNLVSPESGVLATVVKQDPVYATFNVSEKAYLGFRQNAEENGVANGDTLNLVKLRLQLSDQTLYEHPGTLDFADVQVDASTDTVALRGTFPNPDGLLIDRQFVVVVVQAKTPQSALLIPRSSVGVDQRGTFVMTVGDGNKVEQRPIQMGAQFGNEVVVNGGLKAGDKVITEGITKVRPGIEVTPTPASVPQPKG
jgi:membrane fusion protein (multidrug efflux system)